MQVNSQSRFSLFGNMEAISLLQGGATQPAGADFAALLQNDEQPIIPFELADNHPSNLYGEVKVNGETVAKIFNGGGAETSNALGAKLKKMFEEYADGNNLAEVRAQKIAEMLGGTVELADTALTPAAWATKKSAQLEAIRSGNYAPYIAQEYAQRTDSSAGAGAVEENAPAEKASAADEFRKFLGDSPEQRMRNQFLAQMGLTEEALQAMSPAERAKVEKMIEDRIRESMRQNSGASVSEVQQMLAG